MGRGFAWLDTGTRDSLLDAAQFVETRERRQGFKVGCLGEIALNQGWIDSDSLLDAGRRFADTGYGEYLLGLVDSR